MIGNILRFKTAVALVLLGLLTLLAGIGQKTFWAPPETVTATAPGNGTAAPLTVVDQKLRTLHGGTVKIHVKGEGSFLLASGRPDDVNAWVGKTAHNTVSGVSADRKSLTVDHTDGEATAPSPAGSDLWVTTENANGEMDYSWTPPADGDWSLLLASDGTKAAPSDISMTFPNDTSTPWAIPLMVLGGLLILAGAALLLLKPKSGSRGGEPTDGTDAGDGGGADSDNGRAAKGSAFARRARAQAVSRAKARQTGAAARDDETRPGTAVRAAAPSARRRTAGAAVALLTAAAVAGTGVAAQASQSPSPAPSGGASSSSTSPSGTASAPAAGVAAPVLLDAQFRRVLEQVAGAVDAGDAAKDAAKLAPRVGATELEVRTQNYKIRSQVGSYEARMPVRATKLLTTVVSNKREW
ncbi:MAG TPA: hypothetical protein VFN00_12000, partial [Arthrobacter sp.]|nr:hypothetical protein [Arthrobacter sp.]